jgi:FkbM family methyltransferase
MEHGRLDVADQYCRLFTRHIPFGGVVVDIGACLGDHTLSYLNMVGPAGIVHAFEPNVIAFECLGYNMRNHQNVILHSIALGSKSGRAFVSNYGEPNLGATRLAFTDMPQAPITVAALDDIAKNWPRLAFMKIDAEGSEPDIIAGGLKTIRRLKPVILIEINRPILEARGKTTNDITGPLISLGYSIAPAEPHHSFKLDQVDALCIPSKK